MPPVQPSGPPASAAEPSSSAALPPAALPAAALPPASVDPDATESVRLTAWVHGRVQGVGFRWWTRCRGLQAALVGTAANRDDGSVEVVAEGSPAACRRLLEWLAEEPSTTGRPGRVTNVTHRWSTVHGGLVGFRER